MLYRRIVKRLLDLILSFIIFPFFLILLFFLGPIIYLHDKGSIFFVSPRLGINGNVFNMYKFRTMKMNAADIRNDDGSTYNAANDYRLTKIGAFLRKTSLDEIPQILNVIMGNMSFIGPRPDLPEHKKLYVNNEDRKLLIKPGITGFNQAYFRNSIQWKERIKNDIYYVDNLSLWLDVKIFFKTIILIFRKQNVFISNESYNSDEEVKCDEIRAKIT